MKNRTYETTIPITGHAFITLAIESEKEPTLGEIYDAACAELSRVPREEQIENWSPQLHVSEGNVVHAEYNDFEYEKIFEEESCR